MANQRPGPKRRPATSPERREQTIIGLAMDLAERQIREGTASAQVISHFIKAGSIREQLEQARLTQENMLTAAKIEQLASEARVESLYAKALQAMRAYGGQEPLDIDDA